MSQENRSRVEKIMDALKGGLEVYVLREYKRVYKKKDYLNKLTEVLTDQRAWHDQDAISSPHQAKQDIDIAGWLKAMFFNWESVFKSEHRGPGKLSYREKNYVGLLLNARNRLEHKSNRNTFTDEETQHLAVTATRLLKKINARNEAKITDEIAREYGHLIYCESGPKPTEQPKPINGQQQQEGVAVTTAPIDEKEKVDNLNTTVPQNQKAIIAIIIIIALVLIGVIALPNVIASLTIDECDPEILGQRYSGFEHAWATFRCRFG